MTGQDSVAVPRELLISAGTLLQQSASEIDRREGAALLKHARGVASLQAQGGVRQVADELWRETGERLTGVVGTLERRIEEIEQPAPAGAAAVGDEMVERGAKGAWEMVPRGVPWEQATHCQDEWRRISRAILEAALATPSAPVGVEGWKSREPAPNWCRTCGKRPNDPLAIFCSDSFHHAATPAVSVGDTARLDWLETMHVEVRVPLVHGSLGLFHASPPDGEDSGEPSDLRERIDAAIASKGEQ